MKRRIVTIIFIAAAFLLQSTVFGRLTFADVRPNLMIVVTASFGFMRGEKGGMAVGFISGLFMDLFWGGLLGFYTLIYTVIGYLNGTFHRMFFDDDIKFPLVLIGISDLVYSSVGYLCLFMLQGKFIFSYFLGHVMLPELVYTILATLVLYQVILHVNRRLEAEEQRSASRFV